MLAYTFVWALYAYGVCFKDITKEDMERAPLLLNLKACAEGTLQYLCQGDDALITSTVSIEQKRAHLKRCMETCTLCMPKEVHGDVLST